VLQDLPGQNNTLGKPIFLPAIDVNDAQTVGGNDPVTLTMAGVPGLAFTVAPNSVTFPDGTTVGKLSLSQVKSDMVPMEPSNGSGPDLIWTLQPAGTRFSTPIQVTLPNTQALPPGAVSEIYQYDHDLEQFVSAGTGHVSADGSVVVSDPGFGITKAGWGHGPVLQVKGTCAVSCNPSTECVIITPSTVSCNCLVDILDGESCGIGTPPTANGSQTSCQLPGTCDQYGHCSGYKVAAGTPCVPKPDFCDLAGECNGVGQCVSTGKVADVVNNSNNGGNADSFSATQNLFSVFGIASNFLQARGLTYITVNATIGKSVSNNTYSCCSSKQIMNSLTTDDSFGPGLTISGLPVPLLIGGVPFGWPLPTGAVIGLYVQASGGMTLTYTRHKDTCTDQNCASITLNPFFQLSFGLNLPAGIVAANAAVTGGFQLKGSGGCGKLHVELSSLPIVGTGSLVAFNGTNFSTTFTFTHTFVKGQVFPLQLDLNLP